jgi:hypothetical protein
MSEVAVSNQVENQSTVTTTAPVPSPVHLPPDTPTPVVSTEQTINPESEKKQNKCWPICCRRQNETERLIKLFEQIKDLNEIQKRSLEFRYITILKEFSKRCLRYSLLFHIGHFIMTVGSLIVPALISVQYADNNVSVFSSPQLQAQIYWITWTLSLLVTMSNGILVLYKVDKKYYFLHTTRERLRSEGWQYIQLTGRYSGLLMNYSKKATHTNQLIAFCYYVEKIRMRQIEEEYYKYEDTQVEGKVQADNKNTSQQTQSANSNSIDWNKLFEEIDKNKDEIQKQSPNEVVQSILKALIVSSNDLNERSSKVKPIFSKTRNTVQSENSAATVTNEVRVPSE